MSDLSPSEREELEMLRKQKAAHEAGDKRGISFKVSEKGAVSVYGLGRFPVTLYQEQWEKLLNEADSIRAFIAREQNKIESKRVRTFRDSRSAARAAARKCQRAAAGPRETARG
jgi:hypothetical protein